jgi:hemolysin III
MRPAGTSGRASVPHSMSQHDGATEIPAVADHGATMLLLDLREPMSALSHGAGVMMALPLTWVFWQRCATRVGPDGCGGRGDLAGGAVSPYQRGKSFALLIFGFSLVICYASSTLYHAARLSGPHLDRLRRLDHVGIYLLIAGTYTPGAWALMRGGWRQGTLTSVWSLAGLCAGRVWFGGILPTWMSTLIYLTLGWGVLFCYRELARGHSHLTLLPLPLGGVFYSIGALINLNNWPILWRGVFGSHELFHCFVIAGSACHVYFMHRVVIPARQPADWEGSGRLEIPILARLGPGRPPAANLGSIVAAARSTTTRHHEGARWISRPFSGRLPWSASFGKDVPGETMPEPAAMLSPAET